MSNDLNFEGWSCPLELRDYPQVVLGHGSGGKLSAELTEHLFLPAFANAALARLSDASVVTLPAGRVAVTTDSFVVRPLFFPGGSIGELAINGTVNDLAMSGARPLYLTAGFILEEGLSMRVLAAVVERMARAARETGVLIVAGDTKVVEKGHGDGVFINTSGIGVVAPEVDLGPDRAQAGDVVLLSGPIGNHGMAILSVREGLEFESPIVSDCAPLHEMALGLLASGAKVRTMRDPTRGGVASALNEIARSSRVGIVLDETRVPVDEAVQSACDLLGLDPLLVANEGKLVAIVAREDADRALAALREHTGGTAAVVVGEVVDRHPGLVCTRTLIGTTRVVPLPVGEQLPRIC